MLAAEQNHIEPTLGESQDDEKPANEASVLSAILYVCLCDRSFSSPLPADP